MSEYNVPSYPVVTFLVGNGGWLAVMVGLAPLAGSVCAVAAGWPLWLIALGAGATVVLTTVLLSYVEVLKIIADTLLPK